MSLPKKTLARTIVSMQGYTDEQCIHEIMAHDGIGPDEAERRFLEAKTQHVNRAVSQYVRNIKRRDAIHEAQDYVIDQSKKEGGLMVAKELKIIASFLQWKTPDDTLDTGRVFSQILLPLERRGLLVEIRDDDGRFIGYGDYTEHEGSLGM